MKAYKCVSLSVCCCLVLVSISKNVYVCLCVSLMPLAALAAKIKWSRPPSHKDTLTQKVTPSVYNSTCVSTYCWTTNLFKSMISHIFITINAHYAWTWKCLQLWILYIFISEKVLQNSQLYPKICMWHLKPHY